MRKHIPISKFVVGLVLGALLFWGSVAVAQQTPTITTMQNAATATGNGTPLSVAGPAANPANVIGAAGVQVTGTFSGTVTFETTTNGSTWTSVMATNLADDTRATTTTAPGQFTIILGSAVQVRARVSAYTSGSITVVGRLVPGLVARVTSGGGGGGSGTVTSVAQSFTGGLISVSGSPVTTSGTLALTVAGTSGGVPYFSSASTWASSAALAANAIVIGGGAGVAPATTTTGTGVLTALAVNVGSAGAFVTFNGAGGTPSSITLTNGSGLPLSTGVTGILPAANGGAGIISGILKANGSGTVSAAVAGTDYLSATAPGSSGQLLYNNANTYAAVTSSTVSGANVSLGGTLAVAGHAAFGSASVGANAVLRAFDSLAPGSDSFYVGLASSLTVTPTANLGSGNFVVGTNSELYLDSSFNFGGFVIGEQQYIEQDGAGNVSLAMGFSTQIVNANSGTMSVVAGINVDSALNSGGGAITTAYGVRIQNQTAGATNYAIYTGLGTVRFGDVVKFAGAPSPESAAGVSIGSATLPFKYNFIAGDSGTPGTNNFKLTGTATAARTITFPDATDTLVGKATTDTLTNKTLTSPTITAPAITTSAIVTRDGLGTTNATGIELINNTAAAAGAQQISPDFIQTAQGWKTTATAASQTVNFRQYVLPVQGTTAPTALWTMQSQINGGGYSTIFSVGNTGILRGSGGVLTVADQVHSNTGLKTDGYVVVGNGTTTSPIYFGSGTDTTVFRASAAGTWQWGGSTGDAASPQAVTFKRQSVVGGTTNGNGATTTEIASLGTSQGVPGRYHIQTGGMIAASGSTQQTAVDRAIFGATKVLTNNSATTIVNVTNANNTSTGGTLDYCVEVTDGTDTQYECGKATYGISNKAGAFSGNTVTKFGNHQNATAGTLTVTIAISAANPGVLSVNANSSLTPSTGYPRITYSLQNLGQQSVAVQ